MRTAKQGIGRSNGTGLFPRAIGRAERAFSLVEIMVSLGIFSLIIVAALSAHSFLGAKMPNFGEEVITQRNIRLSAMVLERRLSQAMEILEPLPVATSPRLLFRDVDGGTVETYVSGGVLQTFRKGSPENGIQGIAGIVPPVRIKNVEEAKFTVISPSQVLVRIRYSAFVKDSGGRSGKFSGSVFVVRLKNAKAAL